MLGPRTFAHLEVDPSKFATIALRDDVEVKLTIIQTERAVTPRTRVYVLEYVEQENRKGFMPATESEYANLFLVRPAEQSGTAGGIGPGRYLVVDLWHYYPTQGIKTCHQWTIWEDDPTAVRTRARLQFLVEDSNNVVLDARDVPLDPPTVKRLGAFYRQIKSVFAQRVHGLPIALPCGCGRPDPACGAQTPPVYSACQEGSAVERSPLAFSVSIPALRPSPLHDPRWHLPPSVPPPTTQGGMVAAPPSTPSPFTTTVVVTVSDPASGGSPSGEACLGAVHLTIPDSS